MSKAIAIIIIIGLLLYILVSMTTQTKGLKDCVRLAWYPSVGNMYECEFNGKKCLLIRGDLDCFVYREQKARQD